MAVGTINIFRKLLDFVLAMAENVATKICTDLLRFFVFWEELAQITFSRSPVNLKDDIFKKKDVILADHDLIVPSVSAKIMSSRIALHSSFTQVVLESILNTIRYFFENLIPSILWFYFLLSTLGNPIEGCYEWAICLLLIKIISFHQILYFHHINTRIRSWICF